jgi:hypothetical protein
MAIIGMPRRTLTKMDESTILVEEKLPMKWKNMVRYCPNNSNNDKFEDNDDEDEHYK